MQSNDDLPKIESINDIFETKDTMPRKFMEIIKFYANKQEQTREGVLAIYKNRYRYKRSASSSSR